MWLRLLLLCACLCLRPSSAAGQPSAQAAPQPDVITKLVLAIEHDIETGDAAALRALAARDIRQAQLSEFVQGMTMPKVTRAALKERDRAVTEAGRVRLLLEILTDRDAEGRVSTWRLDLDPPADGKDGPWLIASVESLSVVSGLFRLALDTATEYDVRNLVVQAPDLQLSLPSGQAFVSRTPAGPTALILLGRGRAEFAPKPEAERGQVRIFAGADVLKTEFDSVFVRLAPGEFDARIAAGALKPRPVDGGHARRASQLFETYLPKSFQIDLNDLSTARWSLVPSANDFVAEIITGKYGPLTYARANSEPEDISFFDRRRHRNIAVYPSDEKLRTRGRFFSEDDKLDYDIVRYEIESSFAPERMWVDGTAKISLRTHAYLSTLTLRLADSLVVRSITSPQFGRLLHLRVVGQNSVLVGFPGTIVGDTDVDLVITYGGRLPPQGIDREALSLDQDGQREESFIPPEPQWAYSNRSYWYPQTPVTDYATAKLTITVPGDLDVVASGTPVGPPTILPAAPGQRGRKKFVFNAAEPTRYLACVISRFQGGAPAVLKVRDDADAVAVIVTSNPRQFNRVRALTEKVTDILKFYGSLLSDAPYSSFTLALMESELPGGHSPAYFAMLNQPLPTSPFAWNNDPVSFQNYPSFFVAHEVAHQWWGQAVGWKNYHEQWLSEGFAQYFAVLYAGADRGPDLLHTLMVEMRERAEEQNGQGPIYLGYRLGHIRNDSRVFRAIVYDKSAVVLHMLRRLVGDDVFFTGLKRYYEINRFKKAGTDDFRNAIAIGTTIPLTRFFEQWIMGSSLPKVRATSRIDSADAATIKVEQIGEVFDFPLTVTVQYENGDPETITIPVTEATVERQIPLHTAAKGAVRRIVTRDDLLMADWVK
jgi:hypothetical protein